MAADDPGSETEDSFEAEDEPLKAKPEKRGRTVWLLAAAGLSVTAVAAIAIWAGLPTDNPGGEPVVVLKLPPEKILNPGSVNQGVGTKIRKSIDPDQPDIKTGLSPEDKRPLEPVKSVNIKEYPNKGRFKAPKRDKDAPPGMTKARIIDPTKPNQNVGELLPRELAALSERGLRTRTAYGYVPSVGKDGRRPSGVFSRVYRPVASGNPAAQARIAIVLGGMGISSEGTHVAINRLPPDITLAFAPYGSGLQRLVNKARRDGHEIMLQLPMEPFDYPDNDPGPKTMLTSLPPSENIKRLEWLMSRFTGFFGVTNYMGARFTTSEQALKPVLNWIGEHGLVYLDDGNSPRSLAKPAGQAVGLNVVGAHEVIDHGQTEGSIKAALERLETRALEDGLAIGIGSGLPLTVKLVTNWSKTLKKRGIILVPVSSTFQDQKS